MYGVGSIVKARRREWVVLPDSTEELLYVQPLGGGSEESTAILTSLEEVTSASFPEPKVSYQLGDYQSATILRDAARLQNRNTTGPFRSFGRVAIDLRPYQIVPLLLALRNEPVRLLIADDVGIGKTVESLMIARELLDRGEIKRFCVLCPRHLAEQWQKEIMEKFHLDAQLYLAETANRVHKRLAAGESVFDHYPIVVSSIDFIKMAARRDHFLRNAPELVIVDEAHTCSHGTDGRHLRREVVEELSKEASRHLLFVTATPHTGNEDAFRNLLTMLNPKFRELPQTLQGDHKRRWRERLAEHMVQRRREDLQKYLEKTPFPEHLETEPQGYVLNEDLKDLLQRIIEESRSKYKGATTQRDKRLRWWSLLSILRAFASSPVAGAATLRARSSLAKAEDVDLAGRRELIDDPDEPRAKDVIPGARLDDDRFLEWADEADKLVTKDKKLDLLMGRLKELLKEGRNPILFCQYIPTAEYVGQHLQKKLKDIGVEYITGEIPSQERETRIVTLGKSKQRVLVATDCLSEGINLQDHFDAVIHYDLAWTPTRHEQREGRVDRYGQPKDSVKSMTLYGKDNWIDGIVLDVLHRKHKAINSSTGVQVPVPPKAGDVLEAIMEGLLIRGKGLPTGQSTLSEYDEETRTSLSQLESQWIDRAKNAKARRTLFSQATIKDEEVLDEIKATRAALGDAQTVKRFFVMTIKSLGGAIQERKGFLEVDASFVNPEVRGVLGMKKEFRVTFDDRAEGAIHLHRTHPLVESLCDYAIETAIDDDVEGPASRVGVIRTDVPTRHDIYLLRFRFNLRMKKEDKLVEEIRLVGLRGKDLVDEPDLVSLLEKQPTSNVDKMTQVEIATQAIKSYYSQPERFAALGKERCREILRTHKRVRDAAKLKLGQVSIEVQGEPDLIGSYTYLPEVKI